MITLEIDLAVISNVAQSFDLLNIEKRVFKRAEEKIPFIIQKTVYLEKSPPTEPILISDEDDDEHDHGKPFSHVCFVIFVA